MLLHQFGEHFILGSQLDLKLLDAFQLGLVLRGWLLFERRSSVLKELLLPSGENVGLQVLLIAQIRDGDTVDQVALENENLLLSGVVFSLFVHGEFLRFFTLTQTVEFSNSR
jgi:hypothetical protein